MRHEPDVDLIKQELTRDGTFHGDWEFCMWLDTKTREKVEEDEFTHRITDFYDDIFELATVCHTFGKESYGKKYIVKTKRGRGGMFHHSVWIKPEKDTRKHRKKPKFITLREQKRLKKMN